MFCFGAVIDEAQGHHSSKNYLSERKGSKARQLIVLKWTLVGFLLATSYKSVLRALLMKAEYENTIDTIDDMLESSKGLLVAGDTPIRYLMDTDPRERVQRLAKKVQYFNYGTGSPQWVYER